MPRFHRMGQNRVQFTAQEEAARDAEEAQFLADQQATQYQRDRANEYPPIVDQLDDIYHNGVDAWKATIKATKDKYPKP